MDVQSIRQNWLDSRHSPLDFEEVEWLLNRVEELEKTLEPEAK